MKKISVCVPTYNRPDTLRELIASFINQDYKNKELIISDDSSNDGVSRMVKSFGDKSIIYYKNNPSLKFPRNLLASMQRASGNYLFIIGDDDVLIDSKVLSKYVEVFEKNSTVGYVYSNQVQFSGDMNTEYIITHFSKSRLFKMGESAIKNLFTSAIFIGGIGIRKTKETFTYYPKKDILHPQVELVGHILNNHDGYGLAYSCVGVRSHDDQIIFRALKDKKVRLEGDHMNVELYNIFNKLKKKYSLSLTDDFLLKKLIDLNFVMLFKEKSILGTEIMENNYRTFCKLFPKANRSYKLKLAFNLARFLTPKSIKILRSSMLLIVRLTNRNELSHYKQKLKMITSYLP